MLSRFRSLLSRKEAPTQQLCVIDYQYYVNHGSKKIFLTCGKLTLSTFDGEIILSCIQEIIRDFIARIHYEKLYKEISTGLSPCDITHLANLIQKIDDLAVKEYFIQNGNSANLADFVKQNIIELFREDIGNILEFSILPVENEF